MKIKRQAKIMEIISAMDIETQEQLLDELQKSGFKSTQATISRDIKELRIVKELTSMGTYRYATSNKEVGGTFSARLNTIFRECVTSFDYAQNMVVIKTLPGLASAACCGTITRRRPSARRSRSWYRKAQGQGEIRCFHCCILKISPS